jgi:hypothetical protein
LKDQLHYFKSFFAKNFEFLDKYCIHNGLPKVQKRAKKGPSSFRG